MQLRVLISHARRIGALGALALLAASGAACGGDSAENLHDGAGTGRRTGSTTGPSPSSTSTSGADGDAQSAQPVECAAIAEGCRCTDEGKIVPCQGQRLDFSDYVTCAGVRQCVHGTWGPCIPTHFVGN